MYQVLARKWRPKTFHELVGQSHVRQALSYALEHDRLHHAYLFTGTRGVGKTTIARIYAKSLNCVTNGISATPCCSCEHCREIDTGRFPDLIEVDAASRRGIDETRDLLDNVPYAPVKGRYKVYLIDEVHMFTRESFNALLKTLEEPPPHVKFILATTDPQKLPATVLSRCLQFHLKSMTPLQIAEHLSTVLDQERIPCDEEALSLLAEAANGSMRDALSLADQAIASGHGRLRVDDVVSLLGAVPAAQIHKLFALLAAGDARGMRDLLYALDSFAPDYLDLLKRILGGLQQITISQLDAARAPEEIPARIEQLAACLPVELVQLWYQIATDAWQNLPYQPDPRTALEMALLRMIALQPLLPRQSPSSAQAVSSAEAVPAPAPASLAEMAAVLTETDAVGKEPEEESPEDAQARHGGSTGPDLTAPATEDVSTSDPIPRIETEAGGHPASHPSGKEGESAPLPEEMPPSGDNEEKRRTLPDSARENPPEKNDTAPALAATVAQPELWMRVLAALSLEDEYARGLAEHSCPIKWKDGCLHLAAPGGGAPWANEARIASLCEALSSYSGRPVTLVIEEDDSISTPAGLRRKHDLQERARAEQAFCSHPMVREITTEIGARIVPGSIYSLKDKE